MNDKGLGIQTDERMLPSGPELDDLANILEQQFIRRRDLFGLQRDDGGYVCVHKRLRHDHILGHLCGEITLGTYLLDEDSRGRYLVFDADDLPDWRRLQAVAYALKDMRATAYLERSRRGGHLWLFFSEPLAGTAIRRFGQGVMMFFGLGGLELFPKQGQLSGGPGSLIRVPFGIHRKTGRRYGFYTLDGLPLAPTLREQLYMLEDLKCVPQSVLERLSTNARAPERDDGILSKRKGPMAGKNRDELPLYEQVKGAISVRDFVGHYISLSQSGKGLCPFHNDTVESFSVNDTENFWYCFACEIGGSVIDFWLHYRDCDFHTAVMELAEMLLSVSGQPEDPLVLSSS